MKPLKPSMKENKRYLLVKGKDLKKNIEKAILEFVGVLGMSKTGLSFIKDESSKGHTLKGTRTCYAGEQESAIICVNREAVDSVRASLVVFPEKMIVEKVSGTLKGLKNKKSL